MSSKPEEEPATPVDPLLLRRTCARFATGVTIVTTLDAIGHPHGMTVNSFASVSLDPPLVLVSIDLKNAILGHFLTSSSFAVNILSEQQAEVSRRFSSAAEDRFRAVPWRNGVTGAPILQGALATLECSLAQTLEAGDHIILIGSVRHAQVGDGRPLVFFNSAYVRIA